MDKEYLKGDCRCVESVGHNLLFSPHPPIFIGTWGSSEDGLRRAAKYGDGWIASAYNITPNKFKEKWKIFLSYRKNLGRVNESFENSIMDVDIRYIEQAENAMATFLVVDKKFSLIMEVKDDSRETFDDSIGLSVYSTSRAGVLSYVSIFESLWNQTELYEHLKMHDNMQKEFINIASHEIRTPTQVCFRIL